MDKDKYRDKNGRFKSGIEKVPGSGRKKGTKNKISGNIADIYFNVFKRLGGEDGLYKWASASKGNRALFYKQFAKMLPANIEGSLVGDVTVEITSAVPRPPTHAENSALSGKTEDELT